MTDGDDRDRRRRIRRSTLREQGSETDLDGTTAEERINMVWQLTLDAWAFMGKPVTDDRMQRDLIRIRRRGE